MKQNKNLRRKLKMKAIKRKGKWLHNKALALKYTKDLDLRPTDTWTLYINICDDLIAKYDEEIKRL